jgi:hypothetical protein
MRIFYRYEYDISKNKYEKPFFAAFELLKAAKLNYKDVLFNIDTFEDKQSKRKSSIHRILEEYEEYNDCYYVKPSLASARSNHIGITNCGPDNWNPKQASIERKEHLFDILKKIPKPWNISYTVVLNQVNWFGEAKKHIQFINELKEKLPTYLPFSSNVSIEFDYAKKQKIHLIFEIENGNCKEEPFLKMARELFGMDYSRLSTYVYFENEEIEKKKKADNRAKEILLPYAKIELVSLQNTDYAREHTPVSISKAIKRIKTLKFLYLGCINGLYTLIKRDEHNNQIKVYFDYANKCLCGAVRYTGLYFEYHLNMNSIAIKAQREVDDYISCAIREVHKLETLAFQHIANLFPQTPHWFKASTD